MPGQLFDKATFHLVRAEGCWLELSESQKEAEALEKQIENLKVQNVLLLKVDDLTEKIETNIETMQKRTKWQRFWQNVGQWIKNRTKDFIALVLGIVAAGEAVYIVYLTVGF
jgi:hypothetical protein